MKQISLVIKDKQGVLAHITELMANANINITDIEAESIGEAAVIVMQVDKYDEALTILRDARYSAISEECLLVRLTDKPGALAHLARRFADAGINIRNIHIMQRDGDNSIAAVSTERSEEAMKLVADILVA